LHLGQMGAVYVCVMEKRRNHQNDIAQARRSKERERERERESDIPAN
jgi:hypothetical protein